MFVVIVNNSHRVFCCTECCFKCKNKSSLLMYGIMLGGNAFCVAVDFLCWTPLYSIDLSVVVRGAPVDIGSSDGGTAS